MMISCDTATRNSVEEALDEAFQAVFGSLETDSYNIGEGGGEFVSIEKRTVAQRLYKRGVSKNIIAEILETRAQNVGAWVK